MGAAGAVLGWYALAAVLARASGIGSPPAWRIAELAGAVLLAWRFGAWTGLGLARPSARALAIGLGAGLVLGAGGWLVAHAMGGRMDVADPWLVPWAAVSEEVLYRGALWALVASRWGTQAALLFTSAAFALAHGGAAPWPWLGGFAFGLVRLLAGSVWAAILAHAMGDAGIFCGLLGETAGAWSEDHVSGDS